MLPISDVHFAFCGIATVAATLGYACARRAVLSLAPSDGSSSADVEAGPPEERPLKRKLDDSDECDPDQEQSRPMKRSKTPPTDQDVSDEDFYLEWEVIVAPPPYEQAVALRLPEQPAQDHTIPPKENSQDVVTPVREPTPPAYPETSPLPEQKGVESGRCATPPPSQVTLSPNEPEIPPAPMTPPKPAKVEPISAFSAFSGSSSPFASYSNASGTSPFALSSQNVRTAPVWRRNNEHESDVFSRARPANALAPSPNDTVAPAKIKPCALSQSKSLVTPSETQSLGKPSTYLTGEEDETVEAELKGAKLFVKRGCKEFTDGIFGHIKILAQKSTPPKTGNLEAETHSRTRLLFRRDPLGQVSMNVGLCPTVRCHFDAAETILRVILMEQVMADDKSSKEDVVIFALKPGRAQKADFQLFAKALCDHEALKSASPTTPASGAATIP